MAGWDSQLLDGAFGWGTFKDHLVATGGHPLVTAEDLCCSPLLGTNGKYIFDTIVAHDLFLQKHGRKVYDAILTHVTRVLALFDAASMTTPEQFAIGTPYLHDIGTAAMTDMTPLVGKSAYNYKDEAVIRKNIFSPTKLNRQQQLSCAFLADQQTQACVVGGFAKGTIDTAKFLAENKILPPYAKNLALHQKAKNKSGTQAYINSTYVREAPELLPGVTLASLKTRGPGPEAVLPSPAATKCVLRQVLTATAATFGDGHSPGGAYLDGMECGWAIPAPPAGKLLKLSFSLFSCEVDMDYLNVYTGDNATGGVLLGHYTGRMSEHVVANGGTIPSVASATGMFVTWKTDTIMSRSWINADVDGFTASYNSEIAGCSMDGECGSATAAGTCNARTGLCICSPGYGGADCSYGSCFGTVTLLGKGVLKSQAPVRTSSRNNARCVWELDTGNLANVVSLRFDRFDLEDKFDTLRVYSYSDTSVKTLLREFSGSAHTPGLIVRSPGRRLMVEFSSDAIHMSSGFEITFESKPADKDCEEDADCSGGSGTCNKNMNMCDCKPGFMGKQCGCGSGLASCSTSSEVGLAPTVISANPSILSPKGGVVSIIGRRFRPGIVTILVADKICAAPVFKSDTVVECHVPPGVGGPHKVIVTCNGIPSAPRSIFSYNLPLIVGISKAWIAEGSKLLVTGGHFVKKSTMCRVKGFIDESLAIVTDETHLQCNIAYSDTTADRVGTLEQLEVSNDGGGRWVSGVTINSPVEWNGGTLIPVLPRTVTYPAEVVIGAIIPTDVFLDPARAAKYVEDTSRAYYMAAATVNTGENYFPGDTRLRIEVLPVDPGAVVDVASSFARQGVKTNATSSSKYYNGLSWSDSRPRTNIIGMVGCYWSSNAIPAARALAPFQLPLVGMDAWSSVLDNATEFPFFVRVGNANSEVVKVLGSYFRSMDWNRIAVVTDDDAFSSDFGLGVANDMKENGGTILYHGMFKMLPTRGVVDKLGDIHHNGTKDIRSHLLRARKEKALIICVAAKGEIGNIALYSALEETGYFDAGNAIIVSEMMDLSSEYIANGKQRVDGMVHMTVEEPHKCRAAKCPHETCGASCVASQRHMNQAYDAVIALATAVAPLFRDGGEYYVAGNLERRLAAMRALRATSLSSDIAASGLLELQGPPSNNRDKWNFRYGNERGILRVLVCLPVVNCVCCTMSPTCTFDWSLCVLSCRGFFYVPAPFIILNSSSLFQPQVYALERPRLTKCRCGADQKGRLQIGQIESGVARQDNTDPDGHNKIRPEEFIHRLGYGDSVGHADTSTRVAHVCAAGHRRGQRQRLPSSLHLPNVGGRLYRERKRQNRRRIQRH